MNAVVEYLSALEADLKTGLAGEHAYRGALKTLLETLWPNLTATNEPKRTAVGAPDFVVSDPNGIPVGHIEAKDLDKDLDDKLYAKQFGRYLHALDNVVITDYLLFRLYRSGNLVMETRIGRTEGGKIKAEKQNFAAFLDLANEFCSYRGATLSTSEALAAALAQKAKILATFIAQALNDDGAMHTAVGRFDFNGNGDSELRRQFVSIREMLLRNIRAEEFSDVYAQTIAYGMFAARWNDPRPGAFHRTRAGELIPPSNPFLRNLFNYVAGYNLDKRLAWVVDSLADVLRAADLENILSRSENPIIHFYENFLAEYNPRVRKSRGVWYTPEPVVRFMVRAADEVLQADFRSGLEDAATVSDAEGRKRHRVQILDPATGTGAFLTEVVKQVRAKVPAGAWPDYAEKHLIPRLHGFEILMAPYTVAHLVLTDALRKTGVRTDERLRIYLTNALEGDNPFVPSLSFANWLSQEANLANHVKQRAPVMLIIGNPPYSGASSNMFDWIGELIDDYKRINDEKLDERNTKWLQDDYVKFIRMAEWILERNETGLVAFINNHSFLDNPTFRGMRKRLMTVFDKIYILDLHGNAKKNESGRGVKDQNVFDIQQGVSINIFVKTGKKTGEAEIYHHELYGERNEKLDFLRASRLSEVPFQKLQPVAPFFFFVPKNFSGKAEYESGFVVTELFGVRSTGVVTARDNLVIDADANKLLARMREFANPEIDDAVIRGKYFGEVKPGKYPQGDNLTWKLHEVRRKMRNSADKKYIIRIQYRPFDYRFIYYHNDMLEGARERTMRHLVLKTNVALAVCRQVKSAEAYRHVFVTPTISESSLVSNYTSEIAQICPLYVYPGDAPVSNLNPEIVNELAERLGIPPPARETEYTGKEFLSGPLNPIDVFDYVYGTLFDEGYRQRYAEFLKIDFPRIPYPCGVSDFESRRNLGRELRLLHLLEHPGMTLERLNATDFPVPGNGRVEGVKWLQNRVCINETQYFSGVSRDVFDYYIGGYPPAQKWLKDREALTFDDVRHYQKIVFAIQETLRLTRAEG